MGRRDWDDDFDFEDGSTQSMGGGDASAAEVFRVNGPPGCG